MLTLFPAITADFYGMKNFGLKYGIVFTAWGIGGVLGPVLGGMVRDITGTYILSYGVSAILSSIGILLSLMIKAPKTPSTDPGLIRGSLYPKLRSKVLMLEIDACFACI